MIDDEKLRAATVDAVDMIARDATFWGINPIKLWDQVTTRIRMAARTCTNPQEWATRVLRSLQVGTPSKPCSKAIADLCEVVGRDSDAWLTMVEREHAYLVAAVRVRRDEVKEARKRAKEAAVPEQDPAETHTPDGKRRGRKKSKDEQQSEPAAPEKDQSELWDK